MEDINTSMCYLNLEFKNLTEEMVGRELKNACEKYYLKEAKQWPNKEKVINLQYNQLVKLDTKNLPTVVQRLLLNVNKIQRMPVLKEYSKLIELSLSFNDLNEIEVDCLPIQLEELKLNGNKIIHVPNLQKFQNLKHLYLADNQIEVIIGLPACIEVIELAGNPIEKLMVDCFPNENVYMKVKTSLSVDQVKNLIQPTKVAFQRGYRDVMLVFLKPMKRALNKIFSRHHSLKVQGLYIDKEQHKLIVNAKTGETEKVLSFLDDTQKKHTQIIEQLTSPKLLHQNFKSGSRLEVQGATNFGTIAAKVVDAKKNVYILTCMHIFCQERDRCFKGSKDSSVIIQDGSSKQVGSSFYGARQSYVPPDTQDEDHSLASASDSVQDPCAILVDIALIPITNPTCIQDFDDIIMDQANGNCQLFLYKGEDNCSELGQGTKVYKTGAQTGSTSGTLFLEDFLYYQDVEPGRQGMESILIKSSQSGVFLAEGDSGSLITTKIQASIEPNDHNVSNHVIAIAIAGQKDMTFPGGITRDAGIGAKVHIGLEVLENKFPELQGLQICYNTNVLCECPE